MSCETFARSWRSSVTASVPTAQMHLAPHLPARRPDPEGAELVWIGERRYRFADEVAHALLAAPPPGAV